jgi:hypothetical protein
VRRIVLPLAVAGLLGLAGCGGGPSKSGFLADADDACRAANAPVASLQAPTSFPELSGGAAKLAAATDEQVPRLRSLDRPSGDEEPTDAVFTALSGVASAAKSLQAAADKKDDRATATAANELSEHAKEAGSRARAYGFTTCGSSTEAPANSVFEGAKKVVGASFVLQAETFCRQASEAIEALPEVTSLAGAVRFLDKEIPILVDLVARIEALVPPPGKEAEVAAFLDAERKVIEKDKELRNAAHARNEALAAELDEEDARLVTAANHLADELGMSDCGTNSAF